MAIWYIVRGVIHAGLFGFALFHLIVGNLEHAAVVMLIVIFIQLCVMQDLMEANTNVKGLWRK